MKLEPSQLDKKVLIEKTVKFYMDMESWNEGGEFDESLKEMAIQIIANEPVRLEQLFPGYKYNHPWGVSYPKSFNFDNNKLDYIVSILEGAQEMALKEMMFTTKEADA